VRDPHGLQQLGLFHVQRPLRRPLFGHVLAVPTIRITRPLGASAHEIRLLVDDALRAIGPDNAVVNA